MTYYDFDPLFGDEQPEIPLTDAPLVRVIAQVQFSPILGLGFPHFIVPFQEAIRGSYPHMVQEVVRTIGPTEFGGDGASPMPNQQSSETFWRFFSEDRQWRISLSTGFVALETAKYTSRADFMERLEVVVSALKATVKTANATRIGVRYIDHVRSPEIDGMANMLRPEMLGVTQSRLGDGLMHCVTESMANCAEGMLFARWGLLPPNGSHDPDVMPPAPTKSWFLDLDVFTRDAEPFRDMNPGVIRDVATQLAVRCYSFFRWAVTDEFIAAYGGKP